MSDKRLGRYEIVGELGKGAMGVVYLARDPLIGRRLALKTFRLGYGTSGDEMEQFRARFLREAQSAGILNHPNIVTIHDVVEDSDQGVVFIAMEYVEGTDLKVLLKRRERLPMSFVVDIGIQLAEGLDYAHQRGVVHRDIKPANIIITNAGQAKITDFGIARVDASNLTVEGQLLGTPNYMAPEQIQGREVDHRADLFSLGVLLYEMVTGAKPFSGENLTMVTHRIVHEPFTPPEDTVAGLPPGIMGVLGKALQKAPDDRYQRGKELAAELEALRADRKAPTPSSVSFLEQAPAGDGEPTSTAEPVPPATAEGPEPEAPPSVEAADEPSPGEPAASGPGAQSPPPATPRPAPLPTPEPFARPPSAAPVPTGTLVLPPPGAPSARPPHGAETAAPSLSKRLMAAAVGGVALVIAVLGLLFLWPGGAPEAAPVADEAWRSDYEAGTRYLEAGDTRAALVAFERAVAIHGDVPELVAARDRARAVAGGVTPPTAPDEDATAADPDPQDGTDPEASAEEDTAAVVERWLTEARDALAERQYDRALDAVDQVKAKDPRNREADLLANAAEDGLARRARARDRLDAAAVTESRPVPPSLAEPPPPPPSYTAPPRNVPPSSTAPPRATPPPPTRAAAGVPIVLNLKSEVAEGIVTVYQGQDRVHRMTFRFGGGGLFGKRGGGSKQERVTLPAEDQELKLYLWREGASTQSVELPSPGSGGARTVAILIDAEGRLRASWQ